MNKSICPVPLNQRPLNEFNNIRDSWIISWPLLEKGFFYRNLLYSWIIFMPISFTVSYGSNFLKNNIILLTFISITASLIFPILLLLRQLLSWRYIYKRLNSENIEYEESGWYDGQIWEKPVDWRAQDLLIAQHQVRPILDHIEMITFIFLAVFFISTILILLKGI